jgi:hypothetical protein
LGQSVDASYRALAVVVAQYEEGLAGVDFNRYAVILQSLIQQQDQWAFAQGQIGQGLIQVYRGLGGGWQIKCSGSADGFRNLSPDAAPGAKCSPAGPEVVPPVEQLTPPDPQQPEPPQPMPPAADAPTPADGPPQADPKL